MRVALPLISVPGVRTDLDFAREGVYFVGAVSFSDGDPAVEAKFLLRWVEIIIIVGLVALSAVVVGNRYAIAQTWLISQWAPANLGKAATIVSLLAVIAGTVLALWKRSQLFTYSLGEIVFGAFSSFWVAYSLWPDGGVAKFAALGSALYVISRGWGNLIDALIKEAAQIKRVALAVRF